MLVIHPKDRTTRVLSLLYNEDEAVRVLDEHRSGKEMGRLLGHTSQHERIMLLGHGSENGLFYRKDDTKDVFDSIIVGHPHAYQLRKHSGNLIGIWCYADKFARKEGLHGLFSGMIISDVKEAQEYGIITLQMQIDEANYLIFSYLRRLLDEGTPLHEIPQLMKEMKHEHSLVADFNKENFFYL